MAHTQSLPQRGDAASRFTVLMLWVLLAVFVVYPLVRLLAMAFTADGSFTLENLRPFVESWYDRQAAVNSILLGCSVGVAGTVLGFIFAFAVTRLSLPKWLCAAALAAHFSALHKQYCAHAFARPQRHSARLLRPRKLQFLWILGHFHFRNAHLLPSSVHDALDDSGAY